MGTLRAALLSVALLVAFDARVGAEESKRAGLFIQLDDGMLTVKAKDVPHREILDGLARKLGFDLVVVGALDTPRTLDLQGKPWDEVLKKALYPANWTFVYGDASRSAFPVKVVVFPVQGGTGAPGPRPPAVSMRAPRERPVGADSQLSPDQRRDEVPAPQERSAQALDGGAQISVLRAAATRGGPEDLAEALSQLSDQRGDIRQLRKAVDGRTEEVRHAIQEMLEAVEGDPGFAGVPGPRP